MTINTAPFMISVNVSPSSSMIPRGTASTQGISYSFSTPQPIDITLSSDKGTFHADGGVVGEVNKPLNVTVRNGSGSVFESLSIPVAVVKRAERSGVNRVTFTRIFTDGTVSVYAQTVFLLTTEAGADFRITRVQLYFENGRAEITLKKNQPTLKAFANIRFTGSGLLEGFWEVDGRLISEVFEHLVYGRTVTLETPDIRVPTFEAGSHRLRFVITNPPTDITFLDTLYFLTAEEYHEILPIDLIIPRHAAEIEYSSATFFWEDKSSSNTYLIEFLDKEGGKPIFSAYTNNTEYKLPQPVLKRTFYPDKEFLWRVKGFDRDGNKTGESPLSTFTFSGVVSYLPGQIIMLLEGIQESTDQVDVLKKKYNLILIDEFTVSSIDLKAIVFQTDEDMIELINSVGKESGVLLAQPNFIYRTMSEPMSNMQNIHKILNLSKLHEDYGGENVTVAVIDTGVDVQHKDLNDRIVGSENLLKEFPYVAEIHGTAVAGIIGASINEYGIAGIAPKSKILALRACRQVSEERPEGECYTTSITKALDMAIERQVEIVNMSFGSSASDELLTKIINEGSRRGVLFVAPVGNAPYQKELPFPASHPDVLAVGGEDEKGSVYPNKEITSKANVCAPALNVFTTTPDSKHNFLNGTSLSSAEVTGMLALALGKNGNFSKKEIPEFHGNFCKWGEELLKISLCEK
jgi:hypothetical protein